MIDEKQDKHSNQAKRHRLATLESFRPLTVRLLPMGIAFVLIVKAALACSAPRMLRSGLKMSFQLNASLEAEQASETHPLMADTVVILKVVLKSPVILESGEAEVAVNFMIRCIVDMVLESIAVYKDPLAEVAVVFVSDALLDVTEQCSLVGELVRADTTPVLVWIICFFGCVIG